MFRRFLSTAPSTATAAGKAVGIAVIPWMGTPAPWFSVALAMLYAELGFAVRLIVHDIPFAGSDVQEIELLRSILPELERRFAVTCLSEEIKEPLARHEQVSVEQLFETNVHSYLCRGSKAQISAASLQESKRLLILAGMHLKGHLSCNDFDHIVIPGGIYGQSGLYYVLENPARGLRIATYDSGNSSIIVGTRGIASHCEDVATVIEREVTFIERNRNVIIRLAREEFLKRMHGRDRFRFQTRAVTKTPLKTPCDVLIPLNLFDDAAGIGRVRSFRDPAEWLESTLRRLVTKAGIHIVVREHPDALKYATNRSIFSDVLKSFEHESRVKILRAEEPCNTYELLSKASLVLPVSTTVGLEAAILGVPVIMESDAYYARAPFVRFADSRNAYFGLIDTALHERRSLPELMREEACVWYYFSQVTNSPQTQFTPIPQNFHTWVKWGYRKLCRNREASLVVQALSGDIPLCRLVAEDQLAHARSETLWNVIWRGRRNAAAEIERCLGRNNPC